MKDFLLTMAFVALFAGCQEEIQVPEKQNQQTEIVADGLNYGQVTRAPGTYTPPDMITQLSQLQ